MIRRFSAVLTVCLLLVSFSPELFAQIYPDREELDVVRLVDGTILKGVILEEVPEQYLEIQLYGGSTFVLGYEQIEAVEREANPDYGTTWIKVDLGALETRSGTPEDKEDDTPDARPRPLSAGGHLVSAYSFGMIPYLFQLPIDMGGWTGDEWDDRLSELELDRSVQAEQEATGGIAGFGLSYTWWKPLERVEGDRWIWGTRGSFGYHHVSSGHINEDGRSVEPRDVYVTVQASHIPIIAEGLSGVAGERAAVLVGGGLGLGVISGTRAEYSLFYSVWGAGGCWRRGSGQTVSL